MTDINPKRGEISIKLGEKEYKGRVTLDAMMKIETSMNMGLLQIAQRLSDGALTLNEMGTIITPVIRGGGNDITQNDVLKMVWDNGTMNCFKIVSDIISNALNPDEGDAKKKEAIAEAS